MANIRDALISLENASIRGIKTEEIESYFLLISRDAKPDCHKGDGYHPLHFASSPEEVRSHLSIGVDVNVKNLETDETPLLSVIKHERSPDVVRELLRNGASITAREKLSMNTPLHLATLRSKLEIIKVLLEFGTAVDAVDNVGDSPLHNAIAHCFGDLRIVELLLKSGSPVNLRNMRGRTPLDYASAHPVHTAELINMLLKFNVEVNDVNTLSRVLFHNFCFFPPLIEHACFTGCDDWSTILDKFFRHQKDTDNRMHYGKLLIKQAFLRCNYPDKLIDYLRNSPFPWGPLAFNYMVLSDDPNLVEEESLMSFVDDCFSEIKLMKEDKIQNDVSIYQFIVSKSGKAPPERQYPPSYEYEADFFPLGLIRMEATPLSPLPSSDGPGSASMSFSVGSRKDDNIEAPLDCKILKLVRENTYPIYSDIILNKIKRQALLDKLVRQQVYTTVQNGGLARSIVLEAVSLLNVAKYLNADEIENLVNAFYSPSTPCFWDYLMEIKGCSSKELQTGLAMKRKLSSPNDHSSSKIPKMASPHI